MMRDTEVKYHIQLSEDDLEVLRACRRASLKNSNH